MANIKRINGGNGRKEGQKECIFQCLMQKGLKNSVNVNLGRIKGFQWMAEWDGWDVRNGHGYVAGGLISLTLFVKMRTSRSIGDGLQAS